jgi:23S rRNA pseudouridine955/2504/2580 synthase
MREVVIGKGEGGRRFDKYLLKYLNAAPQSFIYKMLRKKRIKLNGARASGSETANEGDLVSLYLSDETLSQFMNKAAVPEKAKPLAIIHEDEDIILADKPSGLLTHDGDGKAGGDTLTSRLLFHLASSGEFDPSEASTFTPACCNRLDRNTSGIVACGKTLRGSQELSRMFAEDKAEKIYLAAVSGRVQQYGEISAFIERDGNSRQSVVKDFQMEGGKPASMRIWPAGHGKDFTLLKIQLLTGKTHQIRAFAQHMGHPVLGDPKYGDEAVNGRLMREFGIRRQLLHAQSMVFLQEDGILSKYCNRKWSAPLPGDFARFLERPDFKTQTGV